jgi:hypothetical protein
VSTCCRIGSEVFCIDFRKNGYWRTTREGGASLEEGSGLSLRVRTILGTNYKSFAEAYIIPFQPSFHFSQPRSGRMVGLKQSGSIGSIVLKQPGDRFPSAVTSTVDHPLGSPSLCFPQLPSAVTSTVDHPLGSPSLPETFSEHSGNIHRTFSQF